MNRALRWLLACILTLSGAPTFAQGLPEAVPESVGLSSERLERIDAAIAHDLAEGSKVGAVIAVARHGNLAYLRAFGSASRERGMPMGTDSLFRLYSETKPLVSVGLLMLYEEGRFALTDPLEMHIPEFAGLQVLDGIEGEQFVTRPPTRKPTIHDLFRHTTGFAGEIFALYDGPVEKRLMSLPPPTSLQDIVDRMAAVPLVYEPGTQWRYGLEHDVQAYLIEKFSGLPVDEFLRRRLFEPLGMTETFYAVPSSLAARYASMYELDGRGGAKLLDDGIEGPYATQARAFARGGTGLSSTARDQLRFGQMLLNGGQLDGVRILSRKTVEMMLSDQLPAEVPNVSFGPGTDLFPGYRYGLGIAVMGDVVRSGMLGSTGAANWAGFANTDLFIDPTEDMLILVWTESRPGDYRWMYRVRTLAYQALAD
jgi:CubicO group peptidase (beta-lactamase class C family)